MTTFRPPLHPRSSPAAPGHRAWLAVLAVVALLPGLAFAYTQNRVATGPDGKPLRIHGSVVVVEPDI